MSKAPKLRFKEFSGDWEHKHLDKIVERVTRKNKGTISKLPLTISAQYGLVDQETFFNKTVASKNLEGYYLLENGEFAYNKSYSNGYPWGAIKRLDRYDKGVLSSLYICFRILDKASSDYIKQYFETSKWYKEVSMIAVEGARNHGLLNISVSDFFDTLHYIPSKEEQEKIAYFLSLIDDKISLQGEKVEALKDYKRGMMQKIFSRELRFKDDEGRDYPEWEEKKLSELVIFTNGKAHENCIDEFGEYIVVNSKFISSDGNINKLSNVNLCPLKKNDIVLVMSDVPNGKALAKCYLIDKDNKYTLNQRICGLRSKCDDPIFLYYFINRNKYYLKFDNGVGQTNLRKDEVLECPILLPCKEEQVKIGKILWNLDDKLKKEEDKLDSLNEYKKGLLQQMFV